MGQYHHSIYSAPISASGGTDTEPRQAVIGFPARGAWSRRPPRRVTCRPAKAGRSPITAQWPKSSPTKQHK